MKLRAFDIDKDFDVIKNWITDERTHAFWCANHTNFPLEREDFSLLLKEIDEMFGDAPYVATTDDGEVVGFFCIGGVNKETKETMLKFVMVDGSKRGQGIGKEMLKLVVNHIFETTDAEIVQLNVFPQNPIARKCYEGVGFVERKLTPGAFTYKDEAWDRCNMIIRKDGIKIREGEPKDKKAIEDLFLEMLRTIYNTDDVKGYEEGYLGKFFEGNGDRVYVAEADGKVIGYLSIEEHHDDKDYFYLDDFCVAGAYRGRGLGSEFLKKAEEYAKERNIPAICLHVEKSNTGAMKLYEKNGYDKFRDDDSRDFLLKVLGE